MAGTRQGVVVGLLLSGLIAAASPAMAEAVPLPPPAPQPKTGVVPPPPQPPLAVPLVNPVAPLPSAPAPTATPSWLPPFLGGKPTVKSGETTAFDATQRELAAKVSAYLTSVQALTGNFAQVGPDGRQATGQFYIQKPGKVRFEYEDPSPIEIIADGQSVVVRDRKLATQDIYPLSQTPLRFLLSDRIDLLRDTNLIGIYADDVFITMVIEEKQPLVGTNRLMLMFDAKDFQLKQWTVTDAQGYDTTIAVSNLDTTKPPDPSLFKIDYTRYDP